MTARSPKTTHPALAKLTGRASPPAGNGKAWGAKRRATGRRPSAN